MPDSSAHDDDTLGLAKRLAILVAEVAVAVLTLIGAHKRSI